MGKKVKLSIIIPTKNTLIYLKDNVLSIIDQDYDDYELIISDNHSEDGTYEWVKSLNNPHIKLIKPEYPLVMSEHWDFALNHASGEWIQVLGSDDGVQPFYFQLADFFIKKAEEKQVSIINFPRAYFFWEGCQSEHNDACISFFARTGYTIKNTKCAMLSVLISKNYYFNIPQLYTMSIIHCNVIENVKKKLNSSFFGVCATSPDVSSAVSVCSIKRKYLHSYIPLTWVGTSVRSIAYPTSISFEEKTKQNIVSDRAKWHFLMGEINYWFLLNELKFYFYEALLQHEALQSSFWKKIFYSKWFKTLVFSNVLTSIENSQQKVDCLKSILAINKISFKTVVFYRYHILPCVWIIDRLIIKLNEIKDIKKSTQKMECNLTRSLEDKLSLMDACRIIKDMDKESNFISNFLKKESNGNKV